MSQKIWRVLLVPKCYQTPGSHSLQREQHFRFVMSPTRCPRQQEAETSPCSNHSVLHSLELPGSQRPVTTACRGWGPQPNGNATTLHPGMRLHTSVFGVTHWHSPVPPFTDALLDQSLSGWQERKKSLPGASLVRFQF